MYLNRDPHRAGSVIDLYNKIPDYAEVQHLGNSEFINKIERLKEEFRQIRASLLDDSDVEYITKSTSKVLNISNNTDSQKNRYPEAKAIKFTKSTPLKSFQNYEKKFNNKYDDSLLIRGCELHRNPYNDGSIEYRRTAAVTYRQPEFSSSASSSSLFPSKQNDNRRYKDGKARNELQDDLEDEDSDGSGYESTLSRWSSSPEIYSTRRKEYIPPANIEKRLTIRKSQTKLDQIPAEEGVSQRFKANPIPSHVHEPLFDKIMLKNQKRSQKVREESKEKLMAQVKPFSFSNTKQSGYLHSLGRKTSGTETLNNKKNTKPRKSGNNTANIKTNNNKFGSGQLFKANPAPPRTRALMAAMRLKEQQEYRELKRRLRSEALMKTASLPPSMAARDKNSRSNDARMAAILDAFDNLDKQKKQKNKSVPVEDDDDADSTITDEDRMSEHSCASNMAASSDMKKVSKKKSMYPEPYGSKNHLKSTSNEAVFESTSNDNHASRLRVQAAKRREEARIRREEEELLKIMKAERKQQKLRDSHLHVWRRACSYSAAQDIAMRRQLRFAASILERECFRKDMSTMLCRVRSAPLLLEGGRNKRKFEPCKKHKQELLQLTDRSSKFNTPRLGFGKEKYYSRINWTSHGDELGERYGIEKSETAALAEGSLTNSDNESVKNIQLDSSEDEDSEKSEPKAVVASPKFKQVQEKRVEYKLPAETEDPEVEIEEVEEFENEEVNEIEELPESDHIQHEIVEEQNYQTDNNDEVVEEELAAENEEYQTQPTASGDNFQLSTISESEDVTDLVDPNADTKAQNGQTNSVDIEKVVQITNPSSTAEADEFDIFDDDYYD